MGKYETMSNLRSRCGFYLGLDNLADLIEGNGGGYPFYNVSLEGRNSQLLEIALAGFTSEEIIVETCGVYLIIIGQKKPTTDRTFLIKKIAARSFRKQFIISNNGFVKRAFFQNSILKIVIEYPIAPLRRNIKIDSYDSSRTKLLAPRRKTNLLPRPK
jgi:molecular chaperone IbpA